MIGSAKCDIKSMNFSEPAMAKITDDVYVLTYKGTFDGSCTMDGKTELEERVQVIATSPFLFTPIVGQKFHSLPLPTTPSSIKLGVLFAAGQPFSRKR